MKILTIDNMLEAAQDSKMPDLDAYQRAIEAAATCLQVALARHLKIKAHSEGATWERDLGGLCAAFLPKLNNTKCPEVIHAGDPEGDWEIET